MIRRRSFLGGVAGATAVGTLGSTAADAALTGKRVAVLGGGIGGMSAAQELAERGFEVTVYEKRDIPGGKARSFGVPGTGQDGRANLPGEHGFRFFPGFYKHLPDTMGRIPYGRGSVADNLVDATQTMLAFVGRADVIGPSHPPRDWGDVKELLSLVYQGATLGLTVSDLEWFANRLLVWFTSCTPRRYDDWERMSWWDFCDAEQRSRLFQKVFVIGMTRNIVAAQAEQASTRTAATILVQLLLNAAGFGGSLDRVLNGPTNQVWIDPWLAHLRSLGVKYHLDARVTQLEIRSGRVSGARIEDGAGARWIDADAYVCALPVEAVRPLLPAEALQLDPALARLENIETEWMNGLQFYFDRDIPILHGHTNYLGSPWALTSISQAQFWPEVDLARYGDGQVRGILSVDISNWEKPGIVYGLPAAACTAEQIKDEVWAQLRRHWDTPVRTAYEDAKLLGWHLDPSITFPGDGQARNDEPLVVNTVNAWSQRPEATTRLPNFFLAADYVRTHTDLPSMESANEAARRAVNALLRAAGSNQVRCGLWPLKEPGVFRLERGHDRARYYLGLRNIHDR